MATKATTKKTTSPKTGRIDLSDLNLSSLVSNTPSPAEAGQNIVELDIRNILEDPRQPRTKDNPGFKPESIQELAQTIKVRGLKQPISVRIMPNMPGRYYVNHGARRFRAFKLLGKKTIPAIIDNAYGLVDQAIENMQRSDLTSKEIALVIDQLEKSGMKRKDIAKELGKTPGYVAQFARLNELPAELENLFENGYITDVTLIYEIANYYDRNPAQILVLKQWLVTETDNITRTTWKLFKEVQESKTAKDRTPAANSDVSDGDGVSAENLADLSASSKPQIPEASALSFTESSSQDDVNYDDDAALAPFPVEGKSQKHRFPFEKNAEQSASETDSPVSDEHSEAGQEAPRPAPALNAVDENTPTILGRVQVIRVTYKGKEYAIIHDRVPDLGVSPYDDRALFLLDQLTNEVIRVDTSLDNIVVHSIVFVAKEN